MATAAETIERLAREAERLRIIQLAEDSLKDGASLESLIEKLKAMTA